MVENVKELLSKSFEEIEGSSLIINLLTIYSKLYLNGADPGSCGQCHRDYYIQLKLNGMEQAEKYLEAQNRTCKPSWSGLKYIRTTAKHWNDQLLTDKEAIYLLENKHLEIKDFEVLPADFGKPIPEEKVIQDFQKRHAPRKRK